MMAMIGGINYGGYDFIPNDEVLAWCRLCRAGYVLF